MRHGVDAKIFCPINIRPAVTPNDSHEVQRRHVLHRRERENRRVGAEQSGKIFVRSHTIKLSDETGKASCEELSAQRKGSPPRPEFDFDESQETSKDYVNKPPLATGDFGVA